MSWHGPSTHYPVQPRFLGPYTFGHVQHSRDLEGVDVAILGVPFDTGVTYRTGQRFAPGAIRLASSRLREYNEALDVKPFQVLNCVDYGDAPIIPGDTDGSMVVIESEVAKIVAAGATPVMMGGDHTCTLAHLRAVAKNRPVAVIDFDAHSDTAHDIMGRPYNHATWVRRAVEEGLVDVEHSIQLGLRGSIGEPDERTEVRTALGIEYVTTDDMLKVGAEAVAARIRERVGDAPTYLSLDIDVLDPAFAPGTGTTEVGGPSTRDLQVVLRGLVGTRLVGWDVMEVIPAYDHAELTTTAAMTMIFELLCVLAVSPSDR